MSANITTGLMAAPLRLLLSHHLPCYMFQNSQTTQTWPVTLIKTHKLHKPALLHLSKLTNYTNLAYYTYQSHRLHKPALLHLSKPQTTQTWPVTLIKATNYTNLPCYTYQSHKLHKPALLHLSKPQTTQTCPATLIKATNYTHLPCYS